MQVVDGVLGLLVVGHGDKAVALADTLARLHDDVDLLDGAERGEELPQGALRGIIANVVAENCIPRLQQTMQFFTLNKAARNLL